MAARQLLGDNYGGIVVSDRYSAYSWLPLELENQLFHQWHRWRDGEIDRQELQSLTAPIRQAFEGKLQEASDLGFHKGEKTPWATMVRTCRQILNLAPALWTCLEHPDVEPTNNATERALSPAVIHRKLC